MVEQMEPLEPQIPLTPTVESIEPIKPNQEEDFIQPVEIELSDKDLVDTPVVETNPANEESKEAEGSSAPEEEAVVQDKPSPILARSIEYRDIDLTKEEVDIALPAGRQSDIEKAAMLLPEDVEDSDTDTQVFATVLANGVSTRMYNDVQWSAVSGEQSSDWHQAIRSEGGLIGAVRPKYKESGVRATGQKAVMRVRSLLGKGSPITIPLWHSGFYATFNSPDEDSILAFQNRLSNDRIVLGRKIFGAALANETVYMNKAVLDFAMEHLVGTNLTTDKDGFLENLSALDIQHVAWGLACTIYQNGFDFARAVITDDPSDNQIQTGRINVSKLQRTYRPALTEKQLKHMEKINQRVSPESLAAYQSEFTKGVPREVVLADDVKVTLRVPKATEHLDAGMAWVDGIVALIDASFTVTGGQDARNEAIRNLSKATQMRQFDHWVDKVHVFNNNAQQWEEYLRDDEGTVEALLGEFSRDDDMRRTFFNAVRTYMDDSTVSIIAVAAASKEEEEMAKAGFELLFPIDAVAVFTMLLSRRAGLVRMRSEF